MIFVLGCICKLHYQVSVLVFPFSLSPRSGFCTGKLESIRIVYGKNKICYQGHVRATQFLSGSCTDKRGFIRVLYGKPQHYQDHVRKSRIHYQDHVRAGRALYHGARLWNDLLWNDLLWNDLLWNVLLWNVLLWNDLLWNDSFQPFSRHHFYCV